MSPPCIPKPKHRNPFFSKIPNSSPIDQKAYNNNKNYQIFGDQFQCRVLENLLFLLSDTVKR